MSRHHTKLTKIVLKKCLPEQQPLFNQYASIVYWLCSLRLDQIRTLSEAIDSNTNLFKRGDALVSQIVKIIKQADDKVFRKFIDCDKSLRDNLIGLRNFLVQSGLMKGLLEPHSFHAYLNEALEADMQKLCDIVEFIYNKCETKIPKARIRRAIAPSLHGMCKNGTVLRTDRAQYKLIKTTTTLPSQEESKNVLQSS